MTASPPLPKDLNHLQNGHVVYFYRNRGANDLTAMRGTVVGRGRDPESRLVRLSIAPRDPAVMVHEITPGGLVYRTVNAVFPDLATLTAHAEWLGTASPEEVGEWTRQIVALFDMITA